LPSSELQVALPQRFVLVVFGFWHVFKVFLVFFSLGAEMAPRLTVGWVLRFGRVLWWCWRCWAQFKCWNGDSSFFFFAVFPAKFRE